MRFAVLLASIGLMGCPTRFDGRVYRGEGFAFAVPPLPEPWKPMSRSEAALAFRDETGGRSILVNARCGQDEDDVPLASLTQHLFISFTRREIEDQKVVPFDRREALHTVLTADLDGVPMRYDVWVMKKDGCVYDILYFAPPAQFERGRAAFARFVEGFTTEVERDR
jgi:hypothetical protein